MPNFLLFFKYQDLDNEDNLSYSFSARFKNFSESLPVLSIDEIILPPAPAPSFPNPSENAFNPECFELFNLGFTEIAGISAICFTRLAKFAF